jgi:hypothetical protein
MTPCHDHEIGVGDSTTLRSGNVRYDVRVSECRADRTFLGIVEDVDDGESLQASNCVNNKLGVGAVVEFGLDEIHTCMHQPYSGGAR